MDKSNALEGDLATVAKHSATKIQMTLSPTNSYSHGVNLGRRTGDCLYSASVLLVDHLMPDLEHSKAYLIIIFPRWESIWDQTR